MIWPRLQRFELRPRPHLVALGLALMISGALGAAKAIDQPKQAGDAVDVTVIPIASFSRWDSSQTRFGKLEWRGGLVLSATHASFGGFSGLALLNNGKRLLAVSDAGSWLIADLATVGDRPGALANAVLTPLTGAKGAKLTKQRDRDSESIAVLKGGKEALISFERNARIVRHRISADGIGPQLGTVKLPAAVSTLSRNKGLESVAVLSGSDPLAGAVVTFAERKQDGAGDQIGWLVPAKGKARDLRLKRTGEFDVTDLAALPDGGLIVLWRSFSWGDGVRMRLERLSADQLTRAAKSGTTLSGELLFEADQSYDIDNMEGLAVSAGKDGETLLTLISDDNFNWYQRTILLRFAIVPEKTVAAP